MPGKIIARVRERQAKAEANAHRWAIREYHRGTVRNRQLHASPTGADAFAYMASAIQPELAARKLTGWRALKRWLGEPLM